MALHHYGKNGNKVPHFSDFLHLKITIHISYKYKQIKVPNLVYFGSPSIASYNDYSTISNDLQILSIFFNLKETPIFAFKGQIFRHQSKFWTIVWLESWLNHRALLSVNFMKML